MMRKLNGILKFCVFILFVVIVASCKKDEDPNAAYTPEREAAMIKEWKAAMKKNKVVLDSTATGIFYRIDATKVGTGDFVKEGDDITVKYTGMFMDGYVFDSSSTQNTAGTMTYVHKTDQMIEGWEEGVELLKKGNSAVFMIPSTKAYGPNGYSIIPPYTPLLFIIEVVDIQ